MENIADRHSWAYASGRAAAIESRMAPAALFERMVRAARVEDVARALRESLIGESLKAPERLKEADAAIRGFYEGLVDEMRRLCPDPRVADLFLLRRELQSLKGYIKRVRFGMDADSVESRYSDADWEHLLAGGDTELPPVFGQVLAQVRGVAGDRREPAGLFDAAFDGASLRALCAAATATANGFIAGYFRRFDTARGVEMLWRARLLGEPAEVQQAIAETRHDAALFRTLLSCDTEDWAGPLVAAMDGLRADGLAGGDRAALRRFVAASDRWLMDYARSARFVPFGPERVFGCLVGLEAEAANLALAVGGKAHDIAADVLLAHLKAGYV
jgi:hypothetical protein